MSAGDEALQGVFAGGEDTSGQNTPEGFQDTPGQWRVTRSRRRGAYPEQQDERPTQRDSQATEVITQVATQVEGATPQSTDESAAPVFVHVDPSQETSASDQRPHPEDEVDEDETEIRMSMSEDQERSGARKILEEALPMPLIAEESCDAKTDAGCRVVRPSTGGIEDSDDYAGDSDMSDDMLEQDGPAMGLSSIAASFTQREDLEKQEALRKKAAVYVYKPRGPFQISPAVSTVEGSSSGGETEIEGEPDDETPATSGGKCAKKPRKQSSPQLVKSVSFVEPTAHQARTAPEGQPDLQRSKSTPERSSKRARGKAAERARTKTKRSRLEKATSPPIAPANEEDVDADPDKPKSEPKSELSSEALPAKALPPSRKASRRHKQPKAQKTSVSEDQEASTEEMDTETASTSLLELAAGSNELSTAQKSLPGARSAGKATKADTTSGSADLETEDKAIRIVLTGLEPTAAIKKKIRAIPGAVYESDVDKATHLVAPTEQIKRTVKLLCGISCCSHILDERWLDESARVGKALDERAYCLKDDKAESRWGFDLSSTMYDVPKEQRQQLFAGHSVFVTNHKSVLPPVKDLVKIVERAGGKATMKGKPGLKDLVITSEAALGVATVQKQVATADAMRIYSPELVLSSILQQHVNLQQHRLERPTIGKTWATKRRK